MVAEGTQQQMQDLFLLLLRLGTGTIKASDKECEVLLPLSIGQWKGIMALAERQGVAAIAFDGVQRLFEIYQKKIKAAADSPAEWMRWVLECTGLMTQYEQMNLQQKKVISEIADIFDKEGVRMMIFKGQANASFYQRQSHRAAGDIDCWLFGDADKGDSILKKNGANVTFNWYRHSKIAFRHETIENHRMMGHTRGNRKLKEMERELEAMLEPSTLKSIDGCGKALMPSGQFNACFLTYHALHHFISEGLRMKQILDWAMFLQTQQKEVNWTAFNDFCNRYKLERFAAVMNYIVVEYLGVATVVKGINMDGKYAERILKSTLFEDNYLFNSGKNDWTVRWLLVKKMFGRDRWKYQDIAQRNIWSQLWKNTIGFLRNDND